MPTTPVRPNHHSATLTPGKYGLDPQHDTMATSGSTSTNKSSDLYESSGVEFERGEDGGYVGRWEGDWSSDDETLHIEAASPRRDLRRYPRTPSNPYLPSNKIPPYIPIKHRSPTSSIDQSSDDNFSEVEDPRKSEKTMNDLRHGPECKVFESSDEENGSDSGVRRSGGTRRHVRSKRRYNARRSMEKANRGQVVGCGESRLEDTLATRLQVVPALLTPRKSARYLHAKDALQISETRIPTLRSAGSKRTLRMAEDDSPSTPNNFSPTRPSDYASQRHPDPSAALSLHVDNSNDSSPRKRIKAKPSASNLAHMTGPCRPGHRASASGLRVPPV
ncbi:hypothetical protein I350_01377 [Cryptococcus amylolentus CBS 6273]|uniref:Uncharacterized protein n=1 Tax=Cryptococcus amylolentus CBS 6273 TaxID=1296118 RepID=A0A1E3KCF1_9TREE|nr:hypothetical protein I350_01377 [Cryptococcus amylolentus CBS 6273]